MDSPASSGGLRFCIQYEAADHTERVRKQVEEVTQSKREEFLREVNAQQAQRIQSGVKTVPGRVHVEGTRSSVWQRLQKALAPPAKAKRPPDPIPVAARTALVMMPAEAASDGAGTPVEAPAPSSASDQQPPERLTTAPTDEDSEAEPQGLAKSENGVFSMAFYWTGTEFTAKPVLLTPYPVDMAAMEPRLPAMLHDVPEGAARCLSAEREPCSTADGTQQTPALAVEACRLPLEVEGADGQVSKDRDYERGETDQVSYDPIQGIWIPAQQTPALFTEPAVPFLSNSPMPLEIMPVAQGQQAPDCGNCAPSEETSCLGTDSETGAVLAASPPAAAEEAELKSDASSLSSPTATPDGADSHAAVSTAHESTSVPALPLAPVQPEAAPVAEAASIHDEIFSPAPSSFAHENLRSVMEQAAASGKEAISEAAASPRQALPSQQDANASRWFVLKGMLGDAQAPLDSSVGEPGGGVPVLEVFSLAGGVGKTSVAATLARALSARDERVLLVETSPLGSLPYFFGVCDRRPGSVRTFRPPASSSDAPIRLAAVDPETLDLDPAAQGSLVSEIQRWAHGASRVIVDVGTRSTATLRGLSKVSPTVLVPLIPDLNSVVTATAIESLFQPRAAAYGGRQNVFYVLNQFDSSLQLHQDVRKVLQDRMGERLLPFVLHRTPAVSEALAEGMTVMDYAPDSQIAAEFTSLAEWLNEKFAPADMSSHGRWSER
jgi:cellulose synthase operon protein YhjQ